MTETARDVLDSTPGRRPWWELLGEQMPADAAPTWTEFDDPQFPQTALRMGQAWQAGWDLLAGGAWHPFHQVYDAMMEAAQPPLALGTVKALMRRARQEGYIESRRRRNRWAYRRTDHD